MNLRPLRVVYIGMDIVPPHNEIAGRTVQLLIDNLNDQIEFVRISIPNIRLRRSNRTKWLDYTPLAQVVRGIAVATSLAVALLSELVAKRGLVHVVMPGRSTTAVRLLLFVCFVFRTPTVFTLLKNRDRQIRAARRASSIVAQSAPAYDLARRCLPLHNSIRQINAGTSISQVPGVERNRRELLFMGVPWKESDLKRRGVFIVFELFRRIAERHADVKLTILNRTVSHRGLLDKLASAFPSEAVEIRYEEVSDVAYYYSRCSLLLVPHLDDLCPDSPLSAIEALACGCPVVTTRFNGLHKEINQSASGYVAEGNADALADGACTVLENLEIYHRNAVKAASTYFNVNSFCKSYLEIYRNLI